MSDLHHLCLCGQRDQWGQTLAGVGQSAVDVELDVQMITLETAKPQDDGVNAAVGHIDVLQVHSVNLPVCSDVTDQHCRRRSQRSR